jgi:hypothetical protein
MKDGDVRPGRCSGSRRLARLALALEPGFASSARPKGTRRRRPATDRSVDFVSIGAMAAGMASRGKHPPGPGYQPGHLNARTRVLRERLEAAGALANADVGRPTPSPSGGAAIGSSVGKVHGPAGPSTLGPTGRGLRAYRDLPGGSRRPPLCGRFDFAVAEGAGIEPASGCPVTGFRVRSLTSRPPFRRCCYSFLPLCAAGCRGRCRRRGPFAGAASDKKKPALRPEEPVGLGPVRGTAG